jgi:magnesium-transporting ATPase (P-type)
LAPALGLAGAARIGVSAVAAARGRGDQAQGGQAPLQQGLERPGQTLSLAVVGLTVVLVVIGLWRGLDLHEVLEVSIALAVAVVPEGLPALP